jgi:hypothetical protein
MLHTLLPQCYARAINQLPSSINDRWSTNNGDDDDSCGGVNLLSLIRSSSKVEPRWKALCARTLEILIMEQFSIICTPVRIESADTKASPSWSWQWRPLSGAVVIVSDDTHGIMSEQTLAEVKSSPFVGSDDESVKGPSMNELKWQCLQSCTNTIVLQHDDW